MDVPTTARALSLPSTTGPGPETSSHYEYFEHYHATFYRHVEALSVTPFAARAVDRALTAVLVALLRQHHLDLASWNPNDGAALVVTTGHPVVAEVVETIARRAEEVSGKSATAQLVRDGLYARLDDWARQQHRAAGGGAALGYEQKATATALLVAPTLGDWPLWAVPNSLREKPSPTSTSSSMATTGRCRKRRGGHLAPVRRRRPSA